jgi:hypothetical protein
LQKEDSPITSMEDDDEFVDAVSRVDTESPSQKEIEEGEEEEDKGRFVGENDGFGDDDDFGDFAEEQQDDDEGEERRENEVDDAYDPEYEDRLRRAQESELHTRPYSPPPIVIFLSPSPFLMTRNFQITLIKHPNK